MVKYDLIIFDLDGTLVDSAPDLRHAVNGVLDEHGAAPLSLLQIRSMIGDGAAQLVARAFAARNLDAAEDGAALRRFFSLYEADPTANTVLYEGVSDTLERLRNAGLPLAVCTNKPAGPADIILRKLAIDRHFFQVVGGDTYEFRKPDPRMLTSMIDAFGVGRERVLMVGDSEVDAATAHAASVPFVLMTYGYRRGAVADIACVAALDHFSEITRLVEMS